MAGFSDTLSSRMMGGYQPEAGVNASGGTAAQNSDSATSLQQNKAYGYEDFMAITGANRDAPAAMGSYDAELDSIGTPAPSVSNGVLKLPDGYDPSQYSYTPLDPFGSVVLAKDLSGGGKDFYLSAQRRAGKKSSSGRIMLSGFDRTWNTDPSAIIGSQESFSDFIGQKSESPERDLNGYLTGGTTYIDRTAADPNTALHAHDTTDYVPDQWDTYSGTYNQLGRGGNYAQGNQYIMTTYNPVSWRQTSGMELGSGEGDVGAYDYTAPNNGSLYDRLASSGAIMAFFMPFLPGVSAALSSAGGAAASAVGATGFGSALVSGAAQGAIVGGAGSAISGGDVGKGILYGAAGGAIAGGASTLPGGSNFVGPVQPGLNASQIASIGGKAGLGLISGKDPSEVAIGAASNFAGTAVANESGSNLLGSAVTTGTNALLTNATSNTPTTTGSSGETTTTTTPAVIDSSRNLSWGWITRGTKT